MKKLFLGLAALAFAYVFTTTPAMAATAVPTNLCFGGAGFGSGFPHQLTLKNSGSLKSSGGVIKQYAILGHANTGFPTAVVGNAYVQPASTVLHGTLHGAYIVGAVHRNLAIEFLINLATGTGTSSFWLQMSDGTQNVGSGAVVLFNCQTLPVNGIFAGEGPQGSIDHP